MNSILTKIENEMVLASAWIDGSVSAPQRGEWRRLPYPRKRMRLRLEVEFQCGARFRACRSVFPVLQGFLDGVDEQRMATDEFDILDQAVGTDDHLDFDNAGESEALGDFGISSRRIGENFTRR